MHNETNETVRDIERSIIKTYRKEIWTKFTRAINEYELIRDGDRIAVCISGGKDSTLMAKLFQELMRHGKKNFETIFLVMNPGYNEENARQIEANAELLGIPLQIFRSDIFDVTTTVQKGAQSSPCYLCARMRRGFLYDHARSLGCNKIALGHHYDDVIETILMGMLYGGQIQTMMPKLHSTNFPGMELIRPMYLIREHDVKRWRDAHGLKFLRCACPLTEGLDPESEDALPEIGHKRTEIKRLIAKLKERSPYIEKNIFRSVENVHLGAVIAYKDKEGERHHFLNEYGRKEDKTEDRRKETGEAETGTGEV
ncbi:MAG: tRNA 2-thiocytidine biosynthesis protein TtcA [Lachnospiraceae bacterium]|nr:tRNA 2-thiocytidine biosynthesis protein TtcA [Lachnospiraceae bacterium]